MTDEEKTSIRDLLKTADINLSERQTNILCRAWELSLAEVYEQGLAEGRKDDADYCNHLEIEIAELKAQIEKMKCCGNCSKKHQCRMNVIDSLHCDKWS